MQTYSHFILTAVLNRKRKQQESADSVPETRALPKLAPRAALLGSIAPDLPLIVLSGVFIVRDLVTGAFNEEGASMTQRLFGDMFFNDPWVKFLHNLFHGPLPVILYLIIGYVAWKRGRAWGGTLFWFAAACALHTAIDIPLHYDDGPLIFFPFDWNTRFMSPISYWDPNHFGREAGIVEHLFDLGLLAYLARSWWRNRQERANG